MNNKTDQDLNLNKNNRLLKKNKCKYCGKLFVKKHNREVYCSKDCRRNALREQKARYQAKRRLKIKRKELILPEHQISGMGSYGTSCTGHMRSSFEEEYRAVQREMQRIGLKKRRKY